MNTQENTQAIFAYGSLTQLLQGQICKLYGFRVWWRGFPSLRPDPDSSVTGVVYQIPVDLMDKMDMESQRFGKYHRFKCQVFDGVRYIDTYTYQMTCDADDYTKACSFYWPESEEKEESYAIAGAAE